MYSSQSMMVGQKERYAVYSNLKPMAGSQGQVYFGQNLSTSQEVAIKLCVLDDNEKHFLTLYMEKKSQKTPQNLVNIFEFYQQGQNNQFIIIMERANCGDLQTFLKNSDYLKKIPNTKNTRIQFMKDIATGVKELHEMGIIHRDIKPENILVFSSAPNQYTCKICDFGLAKKADNAKTQQIGTPYYMAPELLQQEDSYTNSVDIWALGCLFYEILAEKTLFNGKSIYDLMISITQSTNQGLEQRINQGLVDCDIQNITELIQKMVKKESGNRINIKEVMTYIYSFKGIQLKIMDKPINQGNLEQQQTVPINQISRIKLRNNYQTSQQTKSIEVTQEPIQQDDQKLVIEQQCIQDCNVKEQQHANQFFFNPQNDQQQNINAPMDPCLEKVPKQKDEIDCNFQQVQDSEQQQNNNFDHYQANQAIQAIQANQANQANYDYDECCQQSKNIDLQLQGKLNKEVTLKVFDNKYSKEQNYFKDIKNIENYDEKNYKTSVMHIEFEIIKFIMDNYDDDIDFDDPQVIQKIKTSGLQNMTYEELIASKNQRLKDFYESGTKLVTVNSLFIQQEASLRHWLIQKKARHLIDFDDKERNQLKQYFNSLDQDGSKSIGIDELEEPLISLGIAESRDDVSKLVYSVDNDGQIYFKEFLEIIKNKKGDPKNSKETMVIDFFKGNHLYDLDMINGRLGQGSNQPINKNLPFSLIISTIRRQKLMDALMANDNKRKEDGEKVMKAYGKLVSQRKVQKNTDSQSSSSKRSSYK
ncbi:hypothetical protein pb186bvf_001029 [Paramecium bursaria]